MNIDLIELSVQKRFLSGATLYNQLQEEWEEEPAWLIFMTLLQKWLRDTHKTVVEITFQMYSKGYEYAVIKTTDNLESESDVHRVTGPKTYGDALEKGLEEALNLI